MCAGVDYPISFYWRDLLRHYPDAKFILSTRDPKKWYVSVRDTIRFMTSSGARFPLSWFATLFGTRRIFQVIFVYCGVIMYRVNIWYILTRRHLMSVGPFRRDFQPACLAR